MSVQTKIFGLLIIVVIGLTLSGNSQAEKKSRDKQNTVRLAAIYPESTKKTDFLCITKAVVADANKRRLLGNIKIELTVNDSQNDVARSSMIATEIVKSQSGEAPIDFVVGARTSQEALVVGKILNDAKIPFIVPLASHPGVTKDRPFVTRMLSTSKRYAYLSALYTARKISAKRVVIIANVSLPYSQFNADEYPKHLKVVAPQVKVKRFDIIQGYNKFDRLVENLLMFKPDAIYMPVYTTDAVAIYTALIKASKPKDKVITLLTSGGVNDGRALFIPAKAGKVAPKLVFNGIWDEQFRGSYANEFKRLRTEYCPKYMDNMRTISAFDTIRFLIKVLAANPQARGKDFMKILRQTNYDGILGPLKYGKDHEPLRPLELFEIHQGRIRFLESYGG